MNPSKRPHHRTLLAAAIAAMLAAPAAAQTVSIAQIEQRISDALTQDVLNTVSLQAAGRAAVATIGLGLDSAGQANVGSIQLGALQGNTLGWNTLSGTRDTAITVGAAGLGVVQTFNSLGGDPPINEGAITQSIQNVASVLSSPAFATAGSATILGVGQIGANTYATAGVNFTAPAADFVLQQDLAGVTVGDTDVAGTLQQTVINTLSANVSGLGSAVIDGLSGTGTSATSAIQYALNTVASAAVFGNGNTITMQSLQNVNNYAGATGAINSVLLNQATASAANTRLPVPGTGVGGIGGALIDPAIRNLDQVAVYTANTINANNPGGTLRLVGGDSLSQTFYDSASPIPNELVFNTTLGQFVTGTPPVVGYPTNVEVTAFNSVIEQSATGLAGQLASINIARALNGAPDGPTWAGFGDSVLSKIGQTISVGLNSVAIAGTAATTVDSVTTPANPANAEVGKLIYAGQLPTGYTAVPGPLPLADGTFGVALASFDQQLSNLNVARLTLGEDLLGAANGAAITPFANGVPAVLGNYAAAATITGNATVGNLSQLLNISANTFSVDGNLTGATLPTQTTTPNWTYLEAGSTPGAVFSSQILAEMGNWSMTQRADTISVSLPNYAIAMTDAGNAAMDSLSQTLVTRINDLTVGRNLTGNFLQNVDGSNAGGPITVALDNVAQATTRLGNVTGIDTRTQLIYASLNNASAGGDFSGVISQQADGIAFVGGYSATDLPAVTLAALPTGTLALQDLPTLNSIVLNVSELGSVNVGNLSQTAFANLNSLSLSGSVNGTLSQYASDVVHTALNNVNASTNLGTVALGGLSQTIVSSVNTMTLGNAIAATVNQAATGGITQSGVNLATVGGPGSTLSTIAGINQVVSNRVNAITTTVSTQ